MRGGARRGEAASAVRLHLRRDGWAAVRGASRPLTSPASRTHMHMHRAHARARARTTTRPTTRTTTRTLLPSRCASRPSASISARATAAATTTAATVTASLASLEWTAQYSPCARLVQHESLRGRGGARWCCTQGMRRGAARGDRRSTCTSYLSTRHSSCSSWHRAPCARTAVTTRAGGCNPMHLRLQPNTPEAATLCTRGCNPVHPGRSPMYPGAHTAASTGPTRPCGAATTTTPTASTYCCTRRRAAPRTA